MTRNDDIFPPLKLREREKVMRIMIVIPLIDCFCNRLIVILIINSTRLEAKFADMKTCRKFGKFLKLIIS